MKLKRTLVFNIILSVLVASLIFFLSQKGILRRLELASLDFSFRLRGNIPFSPHIIIIEITDDNIAKIGRWPWKRTFHAAMTRALTELGAKSVYFDILFSEASPEEDDALLEKAISRSKNTYLPFIFQDTPFDIKNALLPIERFSPHLKGMGSINIYPDIDGALRKIPLVFQEKENLYPHIALKIALDYSGLKIKDVKPNYLLLTDSKNEIKIPLIEKNQMLINWTGKWKDTFKHYSYLDVLAGALNPRDFKDSVCLVAVTAIGLYDIKPTPLEPEYPGIGVIANTISNILDKNFLYLPPALINILLLYLMCLISSLLITGEKPLREALLVILIGAIYFVINFFLFKIGVMLNLATPLLGLTISSLSVGTYNFVRVSIERKTFFKMSVTDGLTGLYNIRYFKLLLETEIILAKPDPSKKFSILMSDVDHFKHFNDTYGHQVGDLVLKEVANVLKTSVRTSDIVARYGGEEMIVLLRGIPLKDALIIAEKLRKGIENAVVRDEKNTYKVTASLGVSIFKQGDTADSVIKRADDGLYKSKESGRNRISTVEESD